jgi:hypothetical protein
MKKIIIPLLLPVFFAGTGCKKTYVNPNAPTQEQVFNSADGMTRAIVGLKLRFAVNSLGVAPIYSSISVSALSTREVVVNNAGSADYAQIENGGNNVSPNNGFVGGLWGNSNVVNSEAQKLIDNSVNIIDVNYRNSVRIYGLLYKAMSLGTLSQFFEKLPINTGVNAVFSTRVEALTKAVQLLDEASTLLSTTVVPTAFTSAVGAEIDLKNTLLALSARYNNMLGNNDAAIAKAAAVDLTKKSQFVYSNTNPNPIYRSIVVQAANTFSPRANMGLTGTLAPDPNDKRLPFYLTKNATNGHGFFLSDANPIPIYLPGEMLLIQAEAYARKNDLTNAVIFLNKVLNKTPAQDVYGVGADLPSYTGALTQAAILAEIYKQRCIELYMSGMKLEDSRRFGRPAPPLNVNPVPLTNERTRNYFPYPQQERDGNTNTPADPAI